MYKPNGYDEAVAFTGQNRSSALPAGGYVCKIHDVKESATKSGSRKIDVEYDIEEGEYKNFFMTTFNAAKKSMNLSFPVKWKGIYSTFLHKKDGTASPFYKGLIISIEESNGYKTNWNREYAQYNGMLVGFVVGEEEFIGNDGAKHTTTRASYATSVNAIRNGEFTVPE